MEKQTPRGKRRYSVNEYSHYRHDRCKGHFIRHYCHVFFCLAIYQDLAIITIFILILAVVGFAGTCCWALFGAAFERFFKKYEKSLNTIMALLLVYCTVTMILDIEE
jgi:hypothetical protein